MLTRMNDHAEAIQLLELWRDKHPDNQEAWMALAGAFRDYAWVARGNGWANTVTAEGWRLMRERMAESLKAALVLSSCCTERSERISSMACPANAFTTAPTEDVVV